MRPSRRKSGSAIDPTKATSSDKRSEPRLSLDSRAFTTQLEEHKRQFDDLAGQVWGKINETREQRSKMDRVPRRSKTTATDERLDDMKEAEEVVDPRSAGRPPPKTTYRAVSPDAPSAVIPPLVSAPPPLKLSVFPAPMPAAVSFPSAPPMPPMPGAPMPEMYSAAPRTSARGRRNRGFMKQSKRLKEHRFRYLRCVMLCHGFCRIFCEPPRNGATQIICDMVTVYEGFNVRVNRAKPTKPMKSFFWTKVAQRHVVSSGFWRDIMEDSTFLDADKLTEKFARVTKVPKRKVAADQKEAESFVKSITIDHRKLVQMSVMLKISRLDVDTLMRYVMAMDEEKLNVRELYSLAPMDQEIEQVMQEVANQNLVNEIHTLTDVERFWWQLCNIPKLKLRLQLWLFKIDFEKEVEFWEEQIGIIRDASQCLMTSDKLKVFFSAVLAVGNYLNDGTRKGDAQGVTLDVLSHLEGMRENGSRQTLMTYVYEILVERRPDAVNLEDDLAPIQRLDRFDWGQMDSCLVVDRALTDMNHLYLTNFGDVPQLDSDFDEKDRDPDATDFAVRDRFDNVMCVFFEEYTQRISRMVRDYDQTLQDLVVLKRDFVDTRSTPEDFFWRWLEFLDAWLRTKESVAHRIRKEQAQVRRAELRRLRLEEGRRRREAMVARGDEAEGWTYRQLFLLNKAQFQRCNSGFFFSYLQKNFQEYGNLVFDAGRETLLVVVNDGELQPDAMKILKVYLGGLTELE